MFAIQFAGLVEQIPTAALAGLLIVVGVQLLKPAHMRAALRNEDLAVYAVTAVCVVFLNLLQGVMIGFALAIVLTGWQVLRASVDAWPEGDEWYVKLEGAATFLVSIPAGTTVTVGVSVNYLDHGAHQAITDCEHVATGGTVRIVGVAETGHRAHQNPRLIEHESREA